MVVCLLSTQDNKSSSWMPWTICPWCWLKHCLGGYYHLSLHNFQIYFYNAIFFTIFNHPKMMFIKIRSIFLISCIYVYLGNRSSLLKNLDLDSKTDITEYKIIHDIQHNYINNTTKTSKKLYRVVCYALYNVVLMLTNVS